MKKNNTISSHTLKRLLLATLFICFFFLPQKAFGEEYVLPKKYDPRETGHVTPVKTQTKDICWSYATTSAIESYLAKNGEQHDFSENYFNYLIAIDATGNEGENPYATTISNGGFLNTGFSHESAADAAQDWSGPVYENTFPDTITGFQPVSKWKDLTAEKHVQSQVTLPKVSLDISQEENDQRVKTIKEYVYRYGNAVHNNRMFTGYETRYHSQYIPKDRVGSINHVTTIVGWDDSFSKERFVHTPSQDGAFIVKNSWGPNWGDQGYYYISYDDFQLKEADINVFTSIEDKDNYYKKYNVAYFTAGSLVPVFPGKERTLATSYSRTLDTAEQLSAVSIKTLTSDMNYEIYVLPNGKPSKNLVGFTKVQAGIKHEIGTETIRLKKPVTLTGKDFSIAVVYRSADKENRQNLPVSPVEKLGLNKGSSYSLNDNGTWEEESFRSFFISGYTNQLSETKPVSITVQKDKLSLLIGAQEKLSASLTPENTTYPGIGFRSLDPHIATVDFSGTVTAVNIGETKIEAFSTRNPSIKREVSITVNPLPKIQNIQLSQTSLNLKDYEQATLSVQKFPENAQSQKIIWTSSNLFVATVDETGKITSRDLGTTVITATTEDGSAKKSCNVTVNSEDGFFNYYRISWATDSKVSTGRSYFTVDDSTKDNLYFQYSAGLQRNSTDNWIEFHLTSQQRRIFQATDYPVITWFNATTPLTEVVIEYTKDGVNFSSKKPALHELEGFRIRYAPEVTDSLRLTVYLKLKVNDLQEEDKRKPILPIQLKKGYYWYGTSTDTVADGINPAPSNMFNLYFTK